MTSLDVVAVRRLIAWLPPDTRDGLRWLCEQAWRYDGGADWVFEDELEDAAFEQTVEARQAGIATFLNVLAEFPTTPIAATATCRNL